MRRRKEGLKGLSDLSDFSQSQTPQHFPPDSCWLPLRHAAMPLPSCPSQPQANMKTSKSARQRPGRECMTSPPRVPTLEDLAQGQQGEVRRNRRRGACRSQLRPRARARAAGRLSTPELSASQLARPSLRWLAYIRTAFQRKAGSDFDIDGSSRTVRRM